MKAQLLSIGIQNAQMSNSIYPKLENLNKQYNSKNAILKLVPSYE